MFNKFVSKPVVIRAVQWTGDNIEKIQEFMNTPHMAEVVLPNGIRTGTLVIDTLEGAMTASMNDWIVKGTHGEFYPIKPDVFQFKYKPVEVIDAEKEADKP